MEFEIGFKDLRVYAYHGVEEFEREAGNEFSVTLSVKVPFHSNMEKDELEYTVSYEELYRIVAQEIRMPRKLLEKVALRIVHRIKEDFPTVLSGSITIEKMHPPVAGMMARAFVTLNF